jgi:hypothetical protein
METECFVLLFSLYFELLRNYNNTSICIIALYLLKIVLQLLYHKRTVLFFYNS